MDTGATPGDPTYFRVIEETFIRLRGAPLLLSPADWQLTEAWRREGIPLDLVCRTLEEVFARRAERGVTARIQSLRYCAAAVEQAWEEVKVLTAGGRRGEPPPLDVPRRLAALAASIPPRLPGRERLAGRIENLSGTTREVEEELQRLDAEVLEEIQRSLDDGLRSEIDRRVDDTLSRLADRLPAEERVTARARFWRQVLRREFGLPVLSLFSPEAEPEAPPDS